MSTENIAKFREAAAASPDLQAKLQAIQSEIARDTAGKIAALSTEAGTPFTAEEFLQHAASSASELSDEQLEAVAGGGWNPSETNVMVSIFTFGIGCGLIASASAVIKGNEADSCQPSKWGK